MIGRRAAVGLSLLSALLFWAIAAQSASAAAATNTTAFTCVEVKEGAGFSDAHCDEEVKSGAKFAHEQVPLNETKKLDATNETTGGSKSTVTLKGTPFGVPTTISCTTMKTNTSASAVHNVEPIAKEHKMTGNGAAEFSSCTVTEVKNCTKVKEPVVAAAVFEGVEGLEGPSGEKNAMGVEFKGEGKAIAEITLEGTCAIAGKAFFVEGSAIGTSGPGETEVQTTKSTGATIVFTAGMGKLTAGGKPATVTMTVTPKGSGGGNHPISITTST